MALTVEDGTGVIGADSYVSVADADTYFSLHGSPSNWTGLTTPLKEAQLRYASSFLDGRYYWIGNRYSQNQGLDWPRNFAYDTDGFLHTGLPSVIADAVCEIAVLTVSQPLSEALDRGGMVKRERVEGVVEVEYFDIAQAERSWPYIDLILRKFIDSSSGGLHGDTIRPMRFALGYTRKYGSL